MCGHGLCVCVCVCVCVGRVEDVEMCWMLDNAVGHK